ncbi:MAG: alternative ribosome rescue aminoacyl-tRNA hydrolase ArfB [Ignavibacteriales bacterium]|nr:alternative ribosome rescue aminoacyl-tRNA hydrolase ArfB [Ignavibacteriales bacterium]
MIKSLQKEMGGASALEITASVRVPVPELHFRTSRSSGPGGQNVNKLETRVELLFDVLRSPSLNREQRDRVLHHLASRVDGEGVLHISSQRSRSQWENKQVTIEKLVSLLRDALKVRKKRMKTAPTRSSNETRVQRKKKHSQKKKLRKVHLGDE